MPPRTDPKVIRYAPGFSTAPSAGVVIPYTMGALANLLGKTGKERAASRFGSSEAASEDVPFTVEALAKFLGETGKDGHVMTFTLHGHVARLRHDVYIARPRHDGYVVGVLLGTTG